MKEKIREIINLGRTKTAKNTYIVFIGNSISAFLGMLAIIYLSRRLGPAGFGIFSIAFALSSLLTNLADFGLNFALVKEVSQSRARNETDRQDKIFSTVLVVKIFICFFISIIGLVGNRWLSINLLRSPEAIEFNKIVFIFLLFDVFYDLVRVYFQALKKFLESTLIYICANIIKLLLIIILYFLWPSFNYYILIYVLAPFLAVLFFASQIKIKFAFHVKEFYKLTRFASWMAVSVVLSAIGENLNIFMVSAKLSSFETGIYSAAEKFILPITIFTGAIGAVLITRTSEFIELKHVKKFIKKIILLQGIIFFLFIFVFPLTNFLPLLLGKQYTSSVVILKILLIGYFFRTAISSLNSVFYPLNKSIIFAIDSFIQIVILLILNHFLIPLFQARGAAFSLVIVNIVIFITNYLFLFYWLRKYENKTLNLD